MAKKTVLFAQRVGQANPYVQALQNEALAEGEPFDIVIFEHPMRLLEALQEGRHGEVACVATTETLDFGSQLPGDSAKFGIFAGIALYAQIRARRPELPVIIFTSQVWNVAHILEPILEERATKQDPRLGLFNEHIRDHRKEGARTLQELLRRAA